MTTSTTRQLFRETVAAVAEKARAKLPPAVNGRIEAAVKLVLLHDVMPQEDGSILVGSSRDPLQSYLLVGTAWECQDFTRGQAPDGWCQHRIAAGIHKRVQEVLPPSPPVETATPPDAVSTADTAPLYEAPASVNCHIMIEGWQVQLTLRDRDETRLLQRLQAVLGQYPLSTPPAPVQGQGQGKAWCAKHQTAMQRHENAKGVWYSHYVDSVHCKGRN